jgi:hypothetical protein
VQRMRRRTEARLASASVVPWKMTLTLPRRFAELAAASALNTRPKALPSLACIAESTQCDLGRRRVNADAAVERRRTTTQESASRDDMDTSRKPVTLWVTLWGDVHRRHAGHRENTADALHTRCGAPDGNYQKIGYFPCKALPGATANAQTR